LRVNLGFDRTWFYGFVNVESYRASGHVWVSAFDRLPFKDKSVKLLQVNCPIFNRPHHNTENMLCEWKRILVPGGKLVFENVASSVEYEKIKSYLAAQHFVPFFSDECWLSQTDGVSRSWKLEAAKESLEELQSHLILDQVSSGDLSAALNEYKRALKAEGRLILSVSDENPKYLQFFDAAFLSELLTKTGWVIERLTQKESTLEVVCRRPKKRVITPNTSVDLAGKRILALGEYQSLRYSQLGFHWDGQARAFDELGMESALIDIRRQQDPKLILEQARLFKPDYILLGLKECLPLVLEYQSEFKKTGAQIIYWFCDPERPTPLPLKGVVDAMFLSNLGQIEEYKKAYGLNRIYYLPQACTPAFMHYQLETELYDIAFAGAVSREKLHTSRAQLIEKLKSKYSMDIRNNVRNTISRFYSRSKLAFGVSDFDAELYTSNRFFIALGCGAAYLFGYFKGAERLIENKKHAAWFKCEEELLELVHFYLTHDTERLRMRQAAQALAHSRHTYPQRLQNLFDTLEGKTDQFRAFLSE
jgi:ubiquinone/menaquinone biosynthesis C-methylase UbiE